MWRQQKPQFHCQKPVKNSGYYLKTQQGQLRKTQKFDIWNIRRNPRISTSKLEISYFFLSNRGLRWAPGYSPSWLQGRIGRSLGQRRSKPPCCPDVSWLPQRWGEWWKKGNRLGDVTVSNVNSNLAPNSFRVPIKNNNKPYTQPRLNGLCFSSPWKVGSRALDWKAAR